MQVFQLADELGARSIDVLDAARAAGLQVNDAGSDLDESQAEVVRVLHRDRLNAAAVVAASPPAPPAVPVVPVPAISPPSPDLLPTAPPGQEGHGPRPVLSMAKAPMHPLIKTAVWQFAGAHVVPCIGIYWFFASYVNAGKGRRQVAWWHGKWGGDTAGLVIQILFWVEIVVVVVFVAGGLFLGSSTAPPDTVPR